MDHELKNLVLNINQLAALWVISSGSDIRYN